MKILIAEDDPFIMKILQMSLNKAGYEFICCIDGLEAMKNIELHKPDIILVDIMLPYFSGLEILGNVKQSAHPVPVIVVSAMGQMSVIDEAMKLGADGYISKPFTMETLFSNINQLSRKALTA